MSYKFRSDLESVNLNYGPYPAIQTVTTSSLPPSKQADTTWKFQPSLAVSVDLTNILSLLTVRNDGDAGSARGYYALTVSATIR